MSLGQAEATSGSSPRKAIFPRDRAILWRPVADARVQAGARGGVVRQDADPGAAGMRGRAATPGIGPFAVCVEQDVLRGVGAHVRGSGRAFGFLLGQVFECPETGRLFALVDQAVAAREVYDEERPERSIRSAGPELGEALDAHGGRPMGWYHAHLPLAPFLSEADMAAAGRLFPEAWQCALLLLPGEGSERGAVFRRTVGEPPARYVYGPFFEFVRASDGRGGRRKTSALMWTNYVTDEAVNRERREGGGRPPEIGPTRPDAGPSGDAADAAAADAAGEPARGAAEGPGPAARPSPRRGATPPPRSGHGVRPTPMVLPSQPHDSVFRRWRAVLIVLALAAGAVWWWSSRGTDVVPFPENPAAGVPGLMDGAGPAGAPTGADAGDIGDAEAAAGGEADALDGGATAPAGADTGAEDADAGAGEAGAGDAGAGDAEPPPAGVDEDLGGGAGDAAPADEAPQGGAVPASIPEFEALRAAVQNYDQRRSDFVAGRIGCELLQNGYLRADRALLAAAQVVDEPGPMSAAARITAWQDLIAQMDAVNEHFDSSGCPRP